MTSIRLVIHQHQHHDHDHDDDYQPTDWQASSQPTIRR
ncbi:unnamed protein product [Anisakis simplex]|uniref:Uncharacterized protein n=1 Tax=Anisakis simplex TaxID=6269 RepID=A0A3P6NSG5_ANISI|nr:unnamed protein product [Anisakis simplex]